MMIKHLRPFWTKKDGTFRLWAKNKFKRARVKRAQTILPLDVNMAR